MPRTVCRCQPVALATSSTVAPSGRRNIAITASCFYTGQIAHKGALYPGQQPALIDNETWTAVRNQLAANTSDRRSKSKAVEPSLLASGLAGRCRG
jgi:hypothetical protein